MHTLDLRGKQVDIRVRNGSDSTFNCRLFTREYLGDKVPVDLTGQTIHGTYWVDGEGHELTVAVVDQEDGRYSISITQADTALIAAGQMTLYSVYTEDVADKKLDRQWGRLILEGPSL